MRENVEYCPVPFVSKVVTIFRASVGVETALRHFKIAINLNKNFGLLIHHPTIFKTCYFNEYFKVCKNEK